MNNAVLTIERPDDATAVLTLNRPERRNALTIELMESLCQAHRERWPPNRSGASSSSAAPARRSAPGLDLHEAAEAELAEHSAQCVARTFPDRCRRAR